mgnify:CR=1 FL=1
MKNKITSIITKSNDGSFFEFKKIDYSKKKYDKIRWMFEALGWDTDDSRR